MLLVHWLVGKEPSFSTAKTKLLKQNRATAHVTVIGYFHSPVTQGWGGKFRQSAQLQDEGWLTVIVGPQSGTAIFFYRVCFSQLLWMKTKHDYISLADGCQEWRTGQEPQAPLWRKESRMAAGLQWVDRVWVWWRSWEWKAWIMTQKLSLSNMAQASDAFMNRPLQVAGTNVRPQHTQLTFCLGKQQAPLTHCRFLLMTLGIRKPVQLFPGGYKGNKGLTSQCSLKSQSSIFILSSFLSYQLPLDMLRFVLVCKFLYPSCDYLGTLFFYL